MSSLFVKHQMKQRNKTGKVEGRGEALVILFCPFSTPSCFLCWLFTYTFCSCILFLFPSPQFAHLTGKNGAGSKGRACSGRAIHTSLPQRCSLSSFASLLEGQVMGRRKGRPQKVTFTLHSICRHQIAPWGYCTNNYPVCCLRLCRKLFSNADSGHLTAESLVNLSSF